MSAAENKIVDAILTYLKVIGVFAWRNNNTPVYDPRRKVFRSMPKGSINGIPDILGILPDGRFLGIECKTKTGKASKSQKLFIEDATSNNAVCFVARSINDVMDEFKERKIKYTTRGV